MLFTFDLDGTLIHGPWIDSVFPQMLSIFQTALHRHGKAVQEDLYAQLRRLFHAEFIKRNAPGRRKTAFDWDDTSRAVGRRLGVEVSINVANILHTACTPDTCWLLPGAADVLAYFRGRAQPMHVLTNGFREHQQIIIQFLEIADYFDRLIAPDTTGFAKPDREIFEHVRNGSATEPILHIGDDLLADVAGAKRAGWQTVWITTKLPDAIRNYPPAERASTPECRAYIADYLHASPDPFRPSVADCQADYVITDLRELIAIYEARRA